MTSLAELTESRELLNNLTLRELRGKYKRSTLGWAWSMLNPIAQLAIFTFVFRFVLKTQIEPGDPSGETNFALWLACGLLPYQFVSQSLSGSLITIVGNGNLIKKVWFPREVLVISHVLSWDVSFLIELGVLSVALLVFGNMVLPWLPAVLVLVAIMSVFAMGLGLLASSINVYFRDVQHFIGIFLQLWFYASPVIYPIRLVEDRADHELLGMSILTIYRLNPMVHFIEAFRNVLFDLRWPPLTTVAYISVWSAVTFAVGYTVFSKLEPRMAEEL